jgi:DNA helicase-2/ATP-dependent DNA helicase PcrA
MVNALSALTGGTSLASAKPESWPQGGLAAQIVFATPDAEADWAIKLAGFLLASAPNHRTGVIARTASRRRFVDAVVEASDLPSYRWDDGVLDTDTARIVKEMLSRFKVADFQAASDPLEHLRKAAGLSGVQDPSTREALGGALNWCCDLLQQGLTPSAIKSRIRVGDESTLLNMPGVHLLTGHVGKGRQFDWVLAIGAEEGCIPDFRATSTEAIQEEAHILSVMLSRARHGAVMMCAQSVPRRDDRSVVRETTVPILAVRPASLCRFADSRGMAESGPVERDPGEVVRQGGGGELKTCTSGWRPRYPPRPRVMIGDSRAIEKSPTVAAPLGQMR